MATKSNQPTSERRAAADKLRKKQRRADARRNFAIVGVCLVIALTIVGAAAYQPISSWWQMRSFSDTAVADIGAAPDVCAAPDMKPADGNQQHDPVGTNNTYEDSPPAFGRHWENWDTFERKFYNASDRPELGQLVHNLEHGYTMLWYDESIADDSAQMDEIRAIADKFEGSDDLRNKFKAIPWTSEDGDPFPGEAHVALTRWASGQSPGLEETEFTGQQVGVWQYCSEVSGAALDQFMLDFPYTDSPEPNGG